MLLEQSEPVGTECIISKLMTENYQRIEYTPYGETWVDISKNKGILYLPYKFSAKELDKETGLYYYGARYLDPKASIWISSDPALGEYIPEAGKGNSKDAGSLPGMGGVYNHINFNLYHYAGNNPIKYTDPDGREINLDGDAEVQKKILKLINNLSSSQYRIENNRLVKDEKNINIYGSQKYSEVIDNLIENGSTYIQIADTYKDEYGKQKPLPLALDGIQQAGYTYGSNDQKIMNVSINGKSAKIIPTANGYADTATPEEILMHELVGHAEPRIMNVVGNAIDKENIIRGELMSKNPSHRFLFRMSDKKHSTHP